jgi:hypothetical protein
MDVVKSDEKINSAIHKTDCEKSAKYEFASSNTTRTTSAFDACFVWKLAPLADERSSFFIENLWLRLTRSSMYLKNVANSYFAYR